MLVHYMPLLSNFDKFLTKCGVATLRTSSLLAPRHGWGGVSEVRRLGFLGPAFSAEGLELPVCWKLVAVVCKTPSAWSEMSAEDYKGIDDDWQLHRLLRAYTASEYSSNKKDSIRRRIAKGA